jgi:hypothetical protein
MNVWLLWFLWSLTAVLAPFAYLEARAWWKNPPNITLSRTVWRIQARYPFFGMLFGFVTGALIFGLGIHFFGFIPACNP